MEQPDLDRIQQIFDAALALSRSERMAYVEKACAGNSDLQREISSLLEAHDLPTDFLDSPVVALGHASEGVVGTTMKGRYLVERKLGPGGMSEVYLALDKDLRNDPVVIKILSPHLLDNPYAQQKFEQEVEALLRTDHTGVVRVTDTGKLDDGRPFIVMKFIDGETLRPQIPPTGMNFQRVALILEQLGEALEHVHEKGVFHRDLKPENIMIRRGSDSVVLVDFGIAKVKDSEIASTTVNAAGTLAYMSPEQVRGEEVTAASDIYSMALVAYEMLTGRQFQTSPPQEPHHVQFPRSLPKKARQILVRALSFEPNDRYQNAHEFCDGLAAALREGETTPEASPWPRRTAIIAGVLVTLSLGVYIWFTKRPTSLTRSKGFNYWLMVQTRGGTDDRSAYKSDGNDTFEPGDKFQLNVLSLDETGYLYVFNEGTAARNAISFRLRYPKKDTDGAANVGANQTVQTDWETFSGPPGAENFWIIWSASPVPELEAAKNQAIMHPQAELTGQDLMAVKQFLKTMQQKVDARDARYKAEKEGKVRARSDIVLTLTQFEHR